MSHSSLVPDAAIAPQPPATTQSSGAEPQNAATPVPTGDKAPPLAPGFVDIAQHRRIRAFLDMAPALSLAKEPGEVLAAFTRGLREAGREPVTLLTLSTVGLPAGSFRVTRFIDESGTNHTPTDNPWRDRDRLLTYQGGLLSAIVMRGEPQLCVDLNLPWDQAVGEMLAPYRSLLAVPAFTQGRPTHWTLQLSRHPGAFSADEVADTVMRSNMVGATVNSVLTANQLRVTNERLQRQVEEIARIQRSLLPDAPPAIRGLELAVDYRPHDRAGGDLYDFVSLTGRRGESDPAGRWAVIVGDVSGHGTPAAVVMAMLTSILYAYPRVPQGPAELLTYANRHLCAKRISGTFTTALIGIFDPATRRFTYARAGHPPALLKAGGRIDTLDAVGDLPLAVLPDTRYEEASVTLEPGQTLVLYTDGIVEEMDPQGRMFGVTGILESLHACKGSPRCAIDSINTALAQHRGPSRPSDDATIVALRAQ